MLPLILLSLLGIGGAAFLFDGGSSGFEPDDDEEDPKLTREGDTLLASESNDIITGADIENSEGFDGPDGVVDTLELLGGDDEYVHNGLAHPVASFQGPL